ncbi:hypothetical protein GGR57DRAFT_392822 [Xylariaceae sp. FL1272]|nr:hypothetical protein GGR57DRAFT_392822 [Xylariaceae sp. FL1272]
MQRRSAGRSRHGCKECKRRHVKCDEGKPACRNCQARHLSCSFIATLGSELPSSHSVLAIAPDSIPRDDPHLPPAPLDGTPLLKEQGFTTPASYSSQNARDDPQHRRKVDHGKTLDSVAVPARDASLTDMTFQLHDLELFHNFTTNFCQGLSVDGRNASPRFGEAIVRQSFTRPYLMEQLLALSAAHMSTQACRDASFYRREATSRQTRALTMFNQSSTAKAEEECFPAFLFSILLCYHALFDALNSRSNFSTFLDELIKGFRLCSGVRVMAGKDFDSLGKEYRRQTGSDLLGMEHMWNSCDPDIGTTFSSKLAPVRRLVEEADVSPATSKACAGALDLLCALPAAGPADRMSLGFNSLRVLRWMVTVPPDFVKLVEQRRAEALVIIAYYGVIVHDARDCWIFSNDAGVFIIRSIVDFLGSYWTEWLAWPMEVVDGSE